MVKFIIPFFVFLIFSSVSSAQVVRAGAKQFTENYILGELVSQTIEDHTSYDVKREFGLQGTGIIQEALSNKKIDLYVEYSGTLTEAVLKKNNLKTFEEIQAAMLENNQVISRPLGFNNTYALAVGEDFAKKYNLKKISDLKDIKDNLRYAFTYEFMSRSDGFNKMKEFYQLNIGPNNLRVMDHALIYIAFENKEADVMEVYSTDAKIKKLNLVLLKDDKNYFPRYDAVIVSTPEFVQNNPEVWEALTANLVGKVSEEQMRQMNAQVDIEKKTAAQVVSGFLNKTSASLSTFDLLKSRLLRSTREHLILVSYSLFAAIAVGLPLAIVAIYIPWLAQFILLLAGLVQTIPSLALLCFLIPVFGIGQLPALVALFLYGLFPIVLNTFTGLQNLDKNYKYSARALGLNAWQRLRYIELPLVSPQILSGIKTSAIIGIGTATLAAFIGAGGYGAPIVIGLAMNDLPTILWGAIPAAVMALCTHLIFEVLRVFIVPKGLRK